MKYFIGMTFQKNCWQMQKISNFQKRVDPFREKVLTPHVLLLPPFNMLSFRDETLEDIRDLLEGMFLGDPPGRRLPFHSYDILVKHKGLLFLIATPFINLLHAQECLLEFLKNEGAQFLNRPITNKRQQDLFTPRLELGSFWDERALALANHVFQETIELPLAPLIEGVFLYRENKLGGIIKEQLFSFATIEDRHTSLVRLTP